jgi:hypothetical protein
LSGGHHEVCDGRDSELADGAVLVYVGVAVDAAERFSAIVEWPENSDFKTNRAMAVLVIDPAIIATADPPAEVDAQLEEWLLAVAQTQTIGMVSVRYNVGAVELPLVRTFLPRTSQLPSRRVRPEFLG